MEIPTLKLELYQQKPKAFAQELGEALETVGVAQVDGINRQSVNKIYNLAEKIFESCSRLNNPYIYNKKMLNRREISFSQSGSTKFLDRFPQFRSLVDELSLTLEDLHHKIIEALEIYLGKGIVPSYKNSFYLFQYYGEGIEHAGGKNILLEEHYDHGLITLSLPATSKGLEGLIANKWEPLQPQTGNVLVLPEIDLTAKSYGRIKALKHRVKKPTSLKTSRLAILYGQ